MIQLLDAMMVMIGCYIITRMFDFLLREDSRLGKSSKAFIQILAIGTITVTVLCMGLAILSFFEAFDFKGIEGNLPR